MHSNSITKCVRATHAVLDIIKVAMHYVLCITLGARNVSSNFVCNVSDDV